MESEGSLPSSQEPSTGPYLEPDQSSPHHSILFLVWIFPVVSFLLAFPPKSYTLPQARYMPCQSDSSWFYHSNYTWRKVLIMKVFIM
jgi:hypothetical protein